jgi:DNA polymerase-3 subunit chi
VTRIDFYKLAELRLDARDRFAVRLAAKAFREGHRTVLLVEDGDAAERLDALLWDEPHVFLPHARVGSADAPRVPVTLGTAEEIRACEETGSVVHDLLVNLALALPERFAAFDRVAEVLCEDEAVLAAGREHYRFYRERGYPLHYHDLGAGPDA